MVVLVATRTPAPNDVDDRRAAAEREAGDTADDRGNDDKRYR